MRIRTPLLFCWPLLLLCEAQGQIVRWDTLLLGSNTFSSPRAADLNGDGVGDIVVDAGREHDLTSRSLYAINGATGEALWALDTRSQLFGSPLFLDITGDGIPEVFSGGRSSQFHCLDGRSGAIIWEATPYTGNQRSDSLPNYYTGQWLEDLTGDGVPEILNVFGGFAAAPATQQERPAGHLVILDGRTGTTLHRLPTPDGRESYGSPVLWHPQGGEPWAVWGSGGETVGGSYWGVPLRSWLLNTPTPKALVSDPAKGAISPASIADMTNDGVPDLVAMTFNGRITVINGADQHILWSVEPYPGVESSNAPRLLRFNEDDVPDVAVNFCVGTFPRYSGGFHCVLDGRDGSVIWRSATNGQLFHSPLAYRPANEARDRLLVVTNDTLSGNCIELLSIAWEQPPEVLFTEQGSVDLASTPLVTDLDNDGYLDIILTTTTAEHGMHSEENLRIRRLATTITVRASGITWGGYLGTQGDGQYQRP